MAFATLKIITDLQPTYLNVELLIRLIVNSSKSCMSETEISNIELNIVNKYLKANLLEKLGNDEKRYEYLANAVAFLYY